jgi:hypothetical protein
MTLKTLKTVMTVGCENGRGRERIAPDLGFDVPRG